MTLLGKTSKVLAILAALGCAAFWIAFVGLGPEASGPGPTTLLIAYSMIALWLLAVVVVHREYFGWAYAVFVATFLPVGLYLLGTPGPFLSIGVLGLLYLLGTVALDVERRRGPGGS